MKIKQWSNGEKYISHCSWQLAEDCEDRNATKEDIKNYAVKHNIEKVSSGICSACEKILNQQLKELEK